MISEDKEVFYIVTLDDESTTMIYKTTMHIYNDKLYIYDNGNWTESFYKNIYEVCLSGATYKKADKGDLFLEMI